MGRSWILQKYIRWEQAAAVVLAGIFLIMAAGCSDSSSSSASVGNYVFKIENEKCSLKEAKVFLLNYQNLIRDDYGIKITADSGEIADDLEKYVKDLTISELAEIYTLDLIAEDNGLSLSEEEQSHAAEAAEIYYSSLNEAEISYLGISQNGLEDLYSRCALARKVYEELTLDVNTEISDDDARVQSLMQIYVTSGSTASSIYENLQSGSSFEDLAAKYNESATTSFYAGRLDFTDEDIVEAVFSLSDGEYTEILEANGGYYIYYCVDHYDEERTEENKETVLEERIEEALDSTYDSYVQDSDSVLNEKVWDKVTVDLDDGMTTNSFFEVYETCFAE